VAAQGKLAAASQQFPKLNVSAALERYLTDRAAHVQPRSKRSEADTPSPYATTLALFQSPASTRTQYSLTCGSAKPRVSRILL